jgi:voltage-gated potassium channel
VLKLVQFLDEANTMARALKASARRISVFFATVVALVVIFGSVMYLVEGEEHGFTSIPRSIYWAIVTMTTVGYGDISPGTALGQSIAAIVMVIGFTIIAVPTGIVVTEMAQARGRRVSTQVCPECASEGHDHDAVFCKDCGSRL